MIYRRKILANRRNSRLSTGPKTPEGKAVSSMNHLKDGLYASTLILANENPEQFRQLQAECLAFYQPTNLSEREKLEQLTAAKWKTFRVERIEQNYFNNRTEPTTQAESEKDITNYNRITQMRTRLHNIWTKLDKELRALRDSRTPPQPEPQPEPKPEPQPEPKPEVPKPEPKPELTPEEIRWRDSNWRPDGMHMGALMMGIGDKDGNWIEGSPWYIWKGKHVDEFPPEAYIQPGEIDPNPPQRSQPRPEKPRR